MASIKIVSEECTGCKACLSACPYQAIEMQDDIASIILDKCNFCGACVEVCPVEAIVLEKEEKVAEETIEDYKGIWVFAEQRRNEIASVVFELIGEGERLAQKLKTELSALLLGYNLESLIEELSYYNLDHIYVVDDEILAQYKDETYGPAMADMIKEFKPEIVLGGGTTVGRSLLPMVAALIKTGLTADCTEFDIDIENQRLLQTRPAFGGNIMATIITPSNRPQMATVRPRIFKRAQPLPQKKQVNIVKKQLDRNKIKERVQFLEFVPSKEETIKLEDADIIVSGGRGLGESKNFQIIEELAKLLGGAVGASRSAVDAGWIPYSHQVGQTGKTVCPKLYVACGISGAIQHQVGMKTSDIIVAINKDRDAPIFKIATYGIVGDLFEIVPAIIKKLKAEN